MSFPKTFKGKYQDYQISLELSSNSEVLKIQALNAKDKYFFAIDTAYLREHPRFTNTIEKPAQIFQYFEKKFSSVVFNRGKLEFPYVGINPIPRIITILLFRERALKHIQKRLTQHQAKVSEIINNNSNSDKIDKQLKELNKTVDRLIKDVNALKVKSEDMQNQIDKIKQGEEFAPIPNKAYRIALAAKPSHQLYVADRNKILLWQHHNDDGQKWRFEADNFGNFTIINFRHELVIQTPGNSNDIVSLLQVGQRNDTLNEKWKICSIKNGLSIKSAFSGLALRTYNNFQTGENVGVDTFVGNQNDTWLIIKLDF